MFVKEGVAPALMVFVGMGTTLLFTALSQDRSQPHPNPTIEVFKNSPITVFEVFKPSSQGRIQIRDDARQAVSVFAFGFAADTVFELL